MKKLRQSKIKMFVSVVIILAVAFCGNWLYKGRKVHFADDMMRQVICLELGKDKNSHDVTYRELETIEEFGLSNVNDTFNISDIEFLKYGKNIKDINIVYVNITDYSVLENCKKLRNIDLWYSDIDSADDLLKLKYVNRLILTGTPLAQNEEEIAKLQKAFPEAEIVVD